MLSGLGCWTAECTSDIYPITWMGNDLNGFIVQLACRNLVKDFMSICEVKGEKGIVFQTFHWLLTCSISISCAQDKKHQHGCFSHSHAMSSCILSPVIHTLYSRTFRRVEEAAGMETCNSDIVCRTKNISTLFPLPELNTYLRDLAVFAATPPPPKFFCLIQVEVSIPITINQAGK